jgi:hypothetical protein
MSESKIIAKLRKLFARAKDQSDTPEGVLAATIAARLMKEHAISVADLDEHEVTEQVLYLEAETEVSNKWWVILYQCIGKYTDIETAHASMRRKCYITFVGYAHNIEICKFLFDSIKHQLENEYKTHCESVRRRCKEEGISYRQNKPRPKAFYTTAILQVRQKLQTLKRQHDSESTRESLFNESVARATGLIYQRKNEVSKFVSTLGWTTSSRYRAGYSSAGDSAGKNVRVQAGLTGSRKLNG